MIGSLIIASEKRRWTFSYSLPESTLMKLLHATKLFLKRFKAVLTNQHFKNESDRARLCISAATELEKQKLPL
uniref:Uncharacterized protein n=1 Tax=Salix viminalis TaxID=40686 RepID=A0A6N2L7K5_SALVM